MPRFEPKKYSKPPEPKKSPPKGKRSSAPKPAVRGVKRYEVTGPQPCHGVKPGKCGDLELTEAEEKRLIETGRVRYCRCPEESTEPATRAVDEKE